jgi:hypothetical protein
VLPQRPTGWRGDNPGHLFFLGIFLQAAGAKLIVGVRPPADPNLGTRCDARGPSWLTFPGRLDVKRGRLRPQDRPHQLQKPVNGSPQLGSRAPKSGPSSGEKFMGPLMKRAAYRSRERPARMHRLRQRKRPTWLTDI